MTITTQSNTVAWGITKTRMWAPRQNVVDNQGSATHLAILTDIIVPCQDSMPKCDKLWLLVFARPQIGMSALPIWMIGTDEVFIPWRAAPGAFRTLPDSCFVSLTEFSSLVRLRDANHRLLPGLGSHHVCSPPRLSDDREFCPDIGPSSGVPMKIRPCHSARITTKPFSAAAIIFAALFTYSTKGLWHEVHSNPKRLVSQE